jgi:FtsZ-interacting cell division protein ZipA
MHRHLPRRLRLPLFRHVPKPTAPRARREDAAAEDRNEAEAKRAAQKKKGSRERDTGKQRARHRKEKSETQERRVAERAARKSRQNKKRATMRHVPIVARWGNSCAVFEYL